VLTRAAFLNRLGGEVARAKRFGMPLVLVMIDLDDFKRVNDDHGHLAGDAVLRQVADLLVRRLRKTDLIGRYSGDEFILLLPDTHGSKAWQILDTIRRKAADLTTETQGGSVRITLSIGGAVFNPETSDVFFVAASLTEELFEAADAALYQAKRGGRNQVVLNR
jgi:diguanylate cyclase